MNRRLLAGALVLMAGAPLARQDEVRPAAEIVREFEAVHIPVTWDRNSKETLEEFLRIGRQACARKAKLALELYRSHPDHAEVPRLMRSRWRLMCYSLDLNGAVDAELENFVGEDTPPALRIPALWARAQARLGMAELDFEAKLAAIDAAIALEPESTEGAFYLAELAGFHTSDMDRARSLAERVVRDYPEGEGVNEARFLLGMLKPLGQRLPFSLVHAVSGEAVTDADFRGAPYLVYLCYGLWEEEEVEAHRKLQADHPDLQVLAICRPPSKRAREALPKRVREGKVQGPVLVAAPGTKTVDWRTNRVRTYFVFNAEGVLEAVGYRRSVVEPHLKRLTAPEPEPKAKAEGGFGFGG